MKCPKCQAKLLPVDGEMFCLQCGTAVMPKRGSDVSAPVIEETTDPLLQKAIMDSLGHEVKFKLPVSGAPPVTVAKSFVSMRQVLAPPQLATAGPALAGPMSHATPVPAPVGPGTTKTTQRPAAVDLVEALASQLARGIVMWRNLPKAWVAGLAVFGLFLVVNGAIETGLQDRVYPGVRVGDVSLSGVPFERLHSRLASLAKPANLTVRVGSQSYSLPVQSGADAEKLAAVEMQVRETGHSTPLPLAGLLEALASKPLSLQVSLSSTAARSEAQQIASQVDYAPSPATVMVVSGKVLLLADKPGQSLDVARAASALQAAYGKTSAVGLQTQKLQALITAGDYSAEVDKAQALLGQTVKIHVKSAVYQPSVAQIGDWLVIAGAGKGVTVNAEGVSSYVAGLPGKFDRVGVFNALIAALGTGKGLDYVASTSKVTSAAKAVSSAVGWPVATYSYCLGNGVNNTTSEKIVSVLTDKAGWTLGGRLSMVKSENSCNFSINIVPANAMSNVDPACKGQATCMSGDEIVVSDAAWRSAPSKWGGTLDSYQTELINHEVGHWLGFQHTSCTAPAASAATPILAAPDLVLSGCSPNWYAIPADQQRTKILPGFN